MLNVSPVGRLAMAGGPEKPTPPPAIAEEKNHYKYRTMADKNADLRDVLSVLVANKIAPKDFGSSLGQIAFLIGDTDKTGAIKDEAAYNRARALLDKVAIFNQRGDIQQLAPKDRVMNFFDLYKSDKGVGDIINTIRSMGAGVDANYNDSPLAGLGKYPFSAPPTDVAPMSRLLMNKVNQKKTLALK